MKASSLLIVAVALLAAGTLSGCKQAQPKAAALAPVPVSVAHVSVEDVPRRLEAIGAVQTISTVSVRPQVNGQLKSVGFAQGQDVHKGQVLFTIDPQPFEAALALAKANLARDTATNELAQVEAKRYADLARQGIVSAEQNEQVQATAAADGAVVSADRAAVASAQVNLDYCTITSPLDGRTGNLMLQAGNVVQANTSVLVTINQMAPIYVAFSVPEQYLQELKSDNTGGALAVRAQGQGEATSEDGSLSFINNTIDNTTGTIQLMATFPNRDSKLWPGEYVNTNVTLSVEPHAVVVPATAVVTGQDDMYVYVVTAAGTVENRPVQTALSSNGMTVIAKGLQPGETVVTDGQLALFPGAKVLVRNSNPVNAQAQ